MHSHWPRETRQILKQYSPNQQLLYFWKCDYFTGNKDVCKYRVCRLQNSFSLYCRLFSSYCRIFWISQERYVKRPIRRCFHIVFHFLSFPRVYWLFQGKEFDSFYHSSCIRGLDMHLMFKCMVKCQFCVLLFANCFNHETVLF